MLEGRKNRLFSVSHARQPDLTLILENVHDPHNISAVLRSCDSIGVSEIYVIYSEPQLEESHIQLGKRSSAGARKWVDVHLYRSVEACVEVVRKKYFRLLGTHLGKEAKSLYDLDLVSPTALVFGNERDGLSDEILPYLDGNFIIPQFGMVKSLNISVACAVTLYEALRQRTKQDYYNADLAKFKEQRSTLFADYIERHETRHTGKGPKE